MNAHHGHCPTLAEQAVLLRYDFNTFIVSCFLELNPTTRYRHNWHIDLIAQKLEAVRQGKIRRLIINIPPRYLKSICASVAFPAFMLGHDPSCQIICASYGQDLASKLALDTRNIMMTQWYRDLFLDTRLSPSKMAVHEFMTTKGGARMATSVGGVLTGRGADLIIIDDPIKPDEAMSDVMRQSANAWFDNTLYTRLNSKSDGAIVVIMQRLHLDDLVGHILQQEGWDVVSLPALAEQDEQHVIDTPGGPQIIHRKAGEPLHVARESLITLQNTRHTLGEYNFAGQYQQSPVPLGGGMVKQVWLRYYAPHELPQPFDYVMQSWDTASKATELADYSVCTTWGVKGEAIYLLNVWREKVGFPDLKRAVVAQHQRYQPSTILIEEKSSGIQLIQELNAAGIDSIKACTPTGDKVIRLHTHTATIENGSLYLPSKAPWLADYVHELTSFPKSKHDDQVDSTTQALTWIKQGKTRSGLFEYYRREAEKLKGKY